MESKTDKIKSSKIFLESLISRGLIPMEASLFAALISRIKLTEEDEISFDIECEEGSPFEGGMAPTEAIVALKRSLE